MTSDTGFISQWRPRHRRPREMSSHASPAFSRIYCPFFNHKMAGRPRIAQLSLALVTLLGRCECTLQSHVAVSSGYASSLKARALQIRHRLPSPYGGVPSRRRRSSWLSKAERISFAHFLSPSQATNLVSDTPAPGSQICGG
jgi:hypothetical protein